MTDQELLDFYEENKNATARIYHKHYYEDGIGFEGESLLLQDLIRLTRLVIDKERTEIIDKFAAELREQDLKMKHLFAEMVAANIKP